MATVQLLGVSSKPGRFISIEGMTSGPGNPQVNVINESGLYSLTLTSRKPIAKRFKRWVTSEVLPTIRKTGSYGVAAGPAALSTLDILNIAMQSEKGRLLAIEQRDHAIQTKAHIGDKKVATAVATASAKSRENNKLRALMGEATQSASIIAVQNKTGCKTYQWRALKNYCTGAGLLTGKSFNPGLQMEVNTYPAEAWLEVYGIDLVKQFGEAAQRLAAPHAPHRISICWTKPNG